MVQVCAQDTWRVAIDCWEPSIFEGLLDRGALVDQYVVRSGWSETSALEIAVDMKDVAMAEMFLDHGASTHASAVWENAIKHWDRTMLEMMLGRGANVDQHVEKRGFWGNSALKIAIFRRDEVMASLFIDHGAKLNGWSLWEFAVRFWDGGMLKMLLDRGTDVHRLFERNLIAIRCALEMAIEWGDLALSLIGLEHWEDVHRFDFRHIPLVGTLWGRITTPLQLAAGLCNTGIA